ncbi:MAG: TRAP transporter substrate-binding protein DctP [Gammaproteobacteria bacterium]|nr:TRAP transporter substrate-binding protein DctP [Gammaproteobacteria bacterium]MDH4316431.1 TRAP transporter substrate-binding protein DctP [Gammaproteobacteria bacterium]MDH5214314.1 TRAP transporter substrate-binding protein DctP [Gammaproteobacteria bacterium]
MRVSIILVALVALAIGDVTQAQTQIKIATLAPENTQLMKELRAGAEEIKTKTAGRVVLKFYAGGVQGTESKVLRKIQIGQLHGGTFSPADFQKQYADLNIYGLPFVFQSTDEVRFVRERLDSTFEKGIQDIGFETFGFAGAGFAIILSNAPVRSQADMQGKKVWLPEGDLISYEAMKAVQLSPVALPLTDVLTGLQTGLVDIVAIPPVVALALQWHTKVKYVTRTPVLYVMGFLAIQKKTFGRLDPADQAVVREVLGGIYARIDANSDKESAAATQALINVGLQDVQPVPGEFDAIRAQMVETNRAMARDGMFSLQVLEQMQALIIEYRADHASEDSLQQEPVDSDSVAGTH